MTRIDNLALRRAIPAEEFDYLTLCHVLHPYRAPRQKINELLKADTIRRVKKGLYVFSPALNHRPVCLEVLANQIYGPSCLSLEYALSFHGLIPERVVELTSVTPKRNKLFETQVGRFSYRYLAPSKYSHGIDRVLLDERHPVLIATPEKALCDYITLTPSVAFDDVRGARDFLENDLRMNPERYCELNSDLLGHLVMVYGDARLAILQSAL